MKIEELAELIQNPDASSAKSAELMAAAQTLEQIALYVWQIARSRQFREAGQIADAERYEKKAQTIYQNLPEETRW